MDGMVTAIPKKTVINLNKRNKVNKPKKIIKIYQQKIALQEHNPCKKFRNNDFLLISLPINKEPIPKPILTTDNRSYKENK